MKCSNCGMDNIVNDAVHCPNCGASLLTPGNWNANQAAPQPQYQQTPRTRAAAIPAPATTVQPPQQYQPPKAPKLQRVPTVMNIGLTEILMLFSGLFLIIVGFDNLDYVSKPIGIAYGGQVFALGLIGVILGFAILAMVIMPMMMKRMDNNIMSVADARPVADIRGLRIGDGLLELQEFLRIPRL